MSRTAISPRDLGIGRLPVGLCRGIDEELLEHRVLGVLLPLARGVRFQILRTTDRRIK